MTICPCDGDLCMDDMCRSTGVCVVTNETMWSRCPVCHCIYSEDSDCACEDDRDDAE